MVLFPFSLSFVVSEGWTVVTMTTYFLYTGTHTHQWQEKKLEQNLALVIIKRKKTNNWYKLSKKRKSKRRKEADISNITVPYWTQSSRHPPPQNETFLPCLLRWKSSLTDRFWHPGLKVFHWGAAIVVHQTVTSGCDRRQVLQAKYWRFSSLVLGRGSESCDVNESESNQRWTAFTCL